MAGGPVNWISNLQCIVTASSIEAAYHACFPCYPGYRVVPSAAQRQAVYIDNQAALQLAVNPVHHQRLKHIDMKYHWIREEVVSKVTELIE